MSSLTVLARLPFGHQAYGLAGLLGHVFYALENAPSEIEAADVFGPLRYANGTLPINRISVGAQNLCMGDDGATMYWTAGTTLGRVNDGNRQTISLAIEGLPPLETQGELIVNFGGPRFGVHGLVVSPRFLAVDVAGPGSAAVPSGRRVQVYTPDTLERLPLFIENSAGTAALPDGRIVVGGKSVRIFDGVDAVTTLEMAEGSYRVLNAGEDAILVECGQLGSSQHDIRVYSISGQMRDRFVLPSEALFGAGFGVINETSVVISDTAGHVYFLPRGKPHEGARHLRLGEARLFSTMPAGQGRGWRLSPVQNSVSIRGLAFEEDGAVLIGTVRTESVEQHAPFFQHAELLRWDPRS